MTRKEQLQQRIETADADRVELWEIERKEAEESNRRFIGKCFIYRNSYSNPQNDEDYWWMYTKVLAVSGTSLQVWRFQTCKYRKIDIEPEAMMAQEHFQIGGYHEIPLAEFNAAWQATMEKLERL